MFALICIMVAVSTFVIGAAEYIEGRYPRTAQILLVVSMIAAVAYVSQIKS